MNIKKSLQQSELVCQMFEMLANRVVDSDSDARTVRIRMGDVQSNFSVMWKQREYVFDAIDRYLREKNFKSLLAIVVVSDDLPTSRWLEKHKFIFSAKGVFRKDSFEQEYLRYLSDLRDEWRRVDVSAKIKEFREWMNLSPSKTEVPEDAPPPAEGLDTDLKLIKLLKREIKNSGRDDWKPMKEIGHFTWPHIDSRQSSNRTQRPLRESEMNPDKGVLSAYEYCVGSDGKPRDERRIILQQIFKARVNELQAKARQPEYRWSDNYVRAFGEVETRRRLRRIAYSIVRLARNAQRNDYATGKDYQVAINAWKTDLHYLHDEYYVKKFGFGSGISPDMRKPSKPPKPECPDIQPPVKPSVVKPATPSPPQPEPKLHRWAKFKQWFKKLWKKFRHNATNSGGD